MRIVLHPLLALLVWCALAPLANAMPTLYEEREGVEALNAVALEQSTAFGAGDYQLALTLNSRLASMAEAIKADIPHAPAMVLYDRAVILDRLGDNAAAIALLDQAYASGQLATINRAYFPLDYYGTVMSTYVDWLQAAGRDDWQTIEREFVDQLYREDGKVMELSKWANVAMLRLTKAGFHGEARAMCERQIEWFASTPELEIHNRMYLGHPTVFVADGDRFVTGIAFREGSYQRNLAYFKADLRDSCAGILEAQGDLAGALQHRSATREVVLAAALVEFVPLIDLRLARLFAFRGDEAGTTEFLNRAVLGLWENVGGYAANEQICEDLPFTLAGESVSTEQVLAKFRSFASTAELAARLDCPTP